MSNAGKSPGFFSEMGKAFATGWKAESNPPNARPKPKPEKSLVF